MRVTSKMPLPENHVFGKLPLAIEDGAKVTFRGEQVGSVVGAYAIDAESYELTVEIEDEWAQRLGLGLRLECSIGDDV